MNNRAITVEDLKHHIRIDDIISYYTNKESLKKSRDGYFILCPFHNEKTPSFLVNTHRNLFFCHGCKVGGDAISFVMEYKKMDFIQAMEEIASIYNYELDLNKNDMMKELDEKTERLLSNKEAMNYLKERSINIEIIKKFNIGFDKGRIYLPIFRNKTHIGYTARTIKDDRPKYLHSKGLDRKNLLYGYRHILDNVDNIFITEGVFDTISLTKPNYNAVAVLGAGLSEIQCKMIESKTESVILCFDNDEAGRKATMKAMDLLLRHTLLDIYVLTPTGKDIDEMIQEGKANDLLDHVENGIIYYIKQFRKRYGKEDKDILRFKRDILNYLNTFDKLRIKEGIKYINNNYIEIKKQDIKIENKSVLDEVISIEERQLLYLVLTTNQLVNDKTLKNQDFWEDDECFINYQMICKYNIIEVRDLITLDISNYKNDLNIIKLYLQLKIRYIEKYIDNCSDFDKIIKAQDKLTDVREELERYG